MRSVFCFRNVCRMVRMRVFSRFVLGQFVLGLGWDLVFFPVCSDVGFGSA